MNTRTFALVASLLCAFGADCAARSYPGKPIRIIVPLAPGGGLDLITRIYALKLQESWGQPVIVDNRGGGGGNIGTDLVAKATPDGYTLLMGYVGHLAVNPSLYRKLPYDPIKDFAPVSLLATAPNVLAAHSSVAANTVQELVALAKLKPDSLSYASGGNGTVGHMVGELFKTVTGINMVHIPYKGNGPAVSDLLGGQVQLMFAGPGVVIPYVKVKKLKALAVASNNRLPELSETPTFREAGYPAVEASAWYGLLAAAGTPRSIIGALNKETLRIMQLPDVRERLAVHGYEVVTSSPEEFAQLIKSDLIKWQKVVKASGAKID